MDKYQPLRDAGTNGVNYDLDTQAVIERLQEWDAKYGVDLSDVTHDTVVVRFHTLPEDVAALAHEVYDFCPDVVDQNFGCFEEMLEMAQETGQEVPASVLQLVDGVDFEDEDYGIELLERSLKQSQSVTLWWD